MRAQIQVSETIHAPAAVVFDFVGNLDRHRQWINGLSYVSERGPLRVGMEYLSKTSALGQEMAGRHRVLRVDPGRVVEIETNSKPFESVIQYTVEDRQDLVRVTVTLLVRSSHAVFGLAVPLLESLMEARLQADLRNLKLLAEDSA